MLNICRITLDFGDIFVGVPYSEQACRDAAVALGLNLGYSLSRCNFRFAYLIKGCYAYRSGRYAGWAFYGTGGTEEEMKQEPEFASQYRPENHDCAAGNCYMCNMHVCMVQCICMVLCIRRLFVVNMNDGGNITDDSIATSTIGPNTANTTNATSSCLRVVMHMHKHT